MRLQLKSQKLLLLLLVLPLSMLACQKQPASATIPGQLNTFDGYAYRTLIDSQAFLNSISQQVQAKTMVLTLSQTALFNQVANDNNLAQQAYEVYHAAGGAPSQAQTDALTKAISGLVTDLTTLTGQVGGGK